MVLRNVQWIPSPQDNDYFVGLKITIDDNGENQIEFHYPNNYMLSCAEKRSEDALKLLRTLSLSGKFTDDESRKNTKAQDNFNEKFPLTSYLWLINDYLTYHRYDNREKVIKHGQQGKINWNKTFHNIPIISDGQVIYTDLISERNSQIDNLITQIYLYCVNQSVCNVGWIFNLPYYEYEFGRIDVNIPLFLSIVRQELSKTFDDQKRVRLMHMKNVLIGLDDEVKSSRTILKGVARYDHVFEAMIDEMFSKVEDKRSFFPKATYHLTGYPEPKDTNKLRPDTIIADDENRKIFILDSKNYQYGRTYSSSDLPEVSSIEKQITYGESAKKLKESGRENYTIYNAFVIPFSKNTESLETDFAKTTQNLIFYESATMNNNLAYAGYATAAWPGENDREDRKIAIILIDLNFLIDNWYIQDNNTISSMCRLIEEKIRGETI